MAIIVKTSTPNLLLRKIKEGIAQGHIVTWSCDQEGHFTHNRPQFVNQAWFVPRVAKGELIFGLLGRKDAKISESLYGIYHGRFIEMLLSHFDHGFTSIETSALGTLEDHF